MNPKFYTKKGWLNAYALACGYEEKFETEHFVVRLYRIATGNTYIVTAFAKYQNTRGGKFVLVSYYNLNEARKAFILLRRVVKNIEKGVYNNADGEG